MVRAAAKNHASVAIVTSPARYDAVLAALDEHGDDPPRPALRPGRGGVPPHRRLRRADRRGAAGPHGRRGRRAPAEPGLPGADDPYPPVLTISMEKVETLRYGENPHQPAARYRRTDREPRAADGPFASGEPPLQGKALSYNNVLDASAAAALARLMRGPAVVICKHTNPCGAAERPTLLEAWEAALAGDPVSAFGGVVAVTGTVDRALAERLVSIFLEVVVAPAFDAGALEVLATKPNLRLVVDASLGDRRRSPRPPRSRSAPSGPRAAASSSPRPTPSPTTRPPGRARRHAGRPSRAPGPGPRLAPVPGRRLERDPARPRRDARGPGLGPGEPRGCLPRRRGQGTPVPGRGGGDRGRCRVRRVLPVRRRPEGAARCRRDRHRPARRLHARRRGARARRAGRARRCWSPGRGTSATERRTIPR